MYLDQRFIVTKFRTNPSCRLKDFKIVQNVVKLFVTSAHGAYVMNDVHCDHNQINKMSLKEIKL